MNEYWLSQYRREYSKYMAEAIREHRPFNLIEAHEDNKKEAQPIS